MLDQKNPQAEEWSGPEEEKTGGDSTPVGQTFETKRPDSGTRSTPRGKQELVERFVGDQ
jgi:hypothetical protein